MRSFRVFPRLSASHCSPPSRGVSLVDVVVGTALIVLVFIVLFGILRAAVQVAGLSKLKATATEIAESQMEYVRSLEYDDIGTLLGIPAGPIPQNATTTNGGLEYDVRTYIAYIDDSADGLGVLDSTGITTDYKVIKVVVFYDVGGVERNVTLISNSVPKGIESTTGGGTLQINVANAVGAPVSGATVRIENSSVSPSIDLSTFSDAGGTVFLPGAPTSTEYRITVSKTGYSSDETHERDATNVNPTPGYFTVIEGSTTSGTFSIDVLATFILRTFSPIASAVFTDSFPDASLLQSITNTAVSSGTLSLTGAPGTYPASGNATSNAVTPALLASWTSASSTASLPALTSAVVSVANGSGTLLPEAVLPGNSTGFFGVVDLSGISTTTYPSLSLVATLSSSDANVTPQLLDWELGYEAGPTPLPNISFSLTGAKTIGTDSGGTPIYKTYVASTTGATARYSGELEWDSYNLSVPGYDIVLADPIAPYEMLPNTTIEAILMLTPQ